MMHDCVISIVHTSAASGLGLHHRASSPQHRAVRQKLGLCGRQSSSRPYACDAWRTFCKEVSYAKHGSIVPTQWDVVHPQDKDLKRYMTRMRQAKMLKAESAIGITLSQSFADVHLPDRSSTTKEVIAEHDRRFLTT